MESACIGQNYSFSGFLSTMLLTFLSISLFLMQQAPRAKVVKCDGSVYDVNDVDVENLSVNCLQFCR